MRREGSTLVLDSGLRVRPDPRCIRGEPVRGAWAHVCVGEPLPYDSPEVQQVRRDALAWWIPLLGESLVCLTTLAFDSVRYAGGITVATDPSFFDDDPFARLSARGSAFVARTQGAPIVQLSGRPRTRPRAARRRREAAELAAGCASDRDG